MDDVDPNIQSQNMSEDCSFVSTNFSTIKKISNFLEMKKIFINDFWQSELNSASAEDIISFCKGCGFILSRHDETNLKAEMFADN